MTINEAIQNLKEILDECTESEDAVCYITNVDATALEMSINALGEIQQYRAIGTVEECLKNKDFLDFLSDKMNPNDFETYLRLYNALEEKGCEE